MAEYLINSFDLHANGIEVKSVTGLESIPGRKGETSQSWDDSDGVEPYVDADDIILKEKEVTMEMYLLADNTITAQGVFTDLENEIYSEGVKVLDIDYTGRTFNFVCKDRLETSRLTKAEGERVIYHIVMKIVITN